MSMGLQNLVGISLEQITPGRETIKRLLDAAARHIADAKVEAISAETRLTVRLNVPRLRNRPGPAGEMIYTESREPTLDLRDEAVLYAEGLLLTLVGIDTGVEVKPAALMLQVVHELVDGDVVFGGIGQIGPDIDNIMILVQPIDRAGDVILANLMTEPTLGFELNFGQGVGDRIARQSRCRSHNV
jgi:hypothetical protein